MDNFEEINIIQHREDTHYHLGELSKTLCRIKLDYNRDPRLVRNVNDAHARIQLIKEIVNNDPRFEWKRIQNEIDSKYRFDPELTGATIHLDWKPAKTPRRALLKLTIEKNSNTYNDEIR